MATKPDGSAGEHTSEMSDDELVRGFARAVKTAVAEAHKAGRWTVHVEDGRLVRVHPDGSREDLGPVGDDPGAAR